MAGESRIDIIIAARDAATSVIKGAFGTLSSEAQSADDVLGQAAGGMNALAAAAGVFGAVQLGKQVFDLAQTAAQADRTRASFEQLAQKAGTTGDAMLQSLRKASAGAVSDASLIGDANRAIVLGVANNAQQLTQLLDVARVRGAAFGRSTADAYNDLVTGIGRMSPLILDNLGIVTGGQKVFEDYAASIGKSASQLTDAEKKQALFNKVIADSQGMLEAQRGKAADAATSFERLSASLDNAKVRIGKLFESSVVADINAFVGALDFLENKLDDIGKNNRAVEILTLIANATQNILNPIGAAASEATSLARGLGLVGPAANEAASSASGYSAALNRSETATDAAADAQQRYALHAKVAAQANYEENASVVTLAGSLPGLTAELNRASAALAGAREAAASRLASEAAGVEGIVGGAQALSLYKSGLQQVDDQIAAVNADFAAGKLTQDEFKLKLAEINQTGSSTFSDIHKAQQDAESSAKRWASAVNNEVNRAYEDLKGKVQGVIGGALNTDTGVDPDKILPRADAINEPARRLADIAVNGFKSPWVEYFKTQFPQLFQQYFAGAAGDTGIKQQAAQLLKNFQDGLEPELLDKEKAKERVRRMILGEQQTNELVKEITDELAAEFGQASPADLKSKVQESLTGIPATTKTKVELDTTGVAAQMATITAAPIKLDTAGLTANLSVALQNALKLDLAGFTAQLKAAFSVPDLAQTAGSTAANAGKAFNDGALKAIGATGNKMIDTVEAQLRADNNLNRIYQSGMLSGAKWGDGFMSAANSIPKSLIDLLVSLVTPGVVQYFKTQAQLTGANP